MFLFLFRCTFWCIVGTLYILCCVLHFILFWLSRGLGVLLFVCWSKFWLKAELLTGRVDGVCHQEIHRVCYQVYKTGCLSSGGYRVYNTVCLSWCIIEDVCHGILYRVFVIRWNKQEQVPSWPKWVTGWVLNVMYTRNSVAANFLSRFCEKAQFHIFPGFFLNPTN